MSSRAFIFAVTSPKGGPGKTTTAQNIAAEFARKGGRVCILDADRQRSAVEWFERRMNTADELREKGKTEAADQLERINVVGVSGRLRQTIVDMANQYDVVIIDVAGRMSAELTTALQVADVALVPVAPSIKTIEVLPELISALEDSEHTAFEHRRVLGFFNNVPTAKAETKRRLEFKDFFSAPAMKGKIKGIKDLVNSWPTAINDADEYGYGVVEMTHDKRQQMSKATAQYQMLAATALSQAKQALNIE